MTTPGVVESRPAEGPSTDAATAAATATAVCPLTVDTMVAPWVPVTSPTRVPEKSVTVPVVGALLSFSLTVGPPAAARLMTRRPASALAVSVALSVLTLWVSIASSYQTNLPVGFYVGALSALVYVVARVASQRVRRRA